MKPALFWIWLAVAVAWAGATAYFCLISWPQLSLDLAKDPATLSAYNHAVTLHILRYAAVAIFPPLLLFGFARRMLPK